MDSNRRDFLYRFVQADKIVMLHTVKTPPQDEWDRYLDELRRYDVSQLGLLVFTDGGAPNARQRKGLNDVLGKRVFLRAVVTNSSAVRKIVTAIGWFSAGVKSFAPGEMDAAIAHLGWTTADLASMRQALAAMRRELAHDIPWLDSAA
jgi:hypothetical protein